MLDKKRKPNKLKYNRNKSFKKLELNTTTPGVELYVIFKARVSTENWLNRFTGFVHKSPIRR